MTWAVDKVRNRGHKSRHGRRHDAHAHPSWAVAEITIVAQENRKDYLGDVVTYERGTWFRGKGQLNKMIQLLAIVYSALILDAWLT